MVLTARVPGTQAKVSRDRCDEVHEAAAHVVGIDASQQSLLVWQGQWIPRSSHRDLPKARAAERVLKPTGGGNWTGRGDLSTP